MANESYDEVSWVAAPAPGLRVSGVGLGCRAWDLRFRVGLSVCGLGRTVGIGFRVQA